MNKKRIYMVQRSIPWNKEEIVELTAFLHEKDSTSYMFVPSEQSSECVKDNLKRYPVLVQRSML